MGKKKLRYLLIVSAIVLAALIVKAVLFFTAEPKITVDYVAEYNKMTRPQNVDPNENAAPYYQKAFDAFVEMPENLRFPFVDWPTDYNDVHKQMLEEWLASNSHSFEYFRIAANKPYYWLERQTSKDNSIFNITFPEMALLRQLIEAVIWDTKLDASKNQFQPAFEKILGCYRAGRQKCRTPSLIMEQLAGLRFKEMAFSNALVILDRTTVDNATLRLFQDALEKELNSEKYVPSITHEKLMFYDAIQRVFVDNGRGTGRLAWRAAYAFDVMCCEWTNIKMRLNCFIGPTRNETLQKADQYFELCETLWTLTPWELHNKDPNYFKKIESLEKSNFLLDILAISPQGILRPYHRAKAKAHALIAILAITRFKAVDNRFPNTLDELASAGYIQSVPMDPYSNKPLVYKVTDGNFKVYSVGEDFSDDGGVIEVVNEARQEPGFRGTTIVPYVHSPDIVYWPVKDLMKLRQEFAFEEAERLKAEKEAEAQKKIEEANQTE